MALDDTGGDVGEAGVWPDAEELAGLDQRGDHRSILAAADRAGKKRILAVQGKSLDRAFDNVGVDLDPAVVEEQAQASPARQGVVSRMSEFAFVADKAELLAQPRLQTPLTVQQSIELVIGAV